MKRNAFTLIELMIAVVVISILMSIVFRLSGIGSDTQKRNLTASRLQRLENCLSGYYAAFGAYPQVPLQRYSRNFRLKVDQYGVQDPNDTGEEEQNNLVWRSVEAACRAQPIGTKFPFREDMDGYVKNISHQLQTKAESGNKHWLDLGFGNPDLKPALLAGFDTGTTNIGTTVDSEDTVFEFGVMSFILPRYLFMLECNDRFISDCDQWKDHNTIPCDPMTGDPYANWRDVWNWTAYMIPSQAVCSRWIANLEGSCRVVTIQKFFGISIGDGAASWLNADNPQIAKMVHYPIRSKSGQNGYILNSITMLDGWGREFYYYSAPPYQSYTLWSAGENGRTFCPWVPLDTLKDDERKTAGVWMADDIIQMSH